MTKDGGEQQPEAEDEGSSWRIPTGLAPSPGLRPSPGITPPRLSSWAGFESDAASEALAVAPDAVPEPTAEPPADAAELAPAQHAASAPPAASEPASSEPASSEPAASEPASSEPAASEPASSEPASSRAASADPAPDPDPAPAQASPPASVPVSAPPASPVYAPPASAAYAPPKSPVKPRKSVGTAVGAAAIGAIVLGSFLGLAKLGADAEDPGGFDDASYSDDAQGTAEQFFDALTTGDTQTAVDLLAGPDAETLNHPPLDADAAPDGQIADVELGEVSDFDTSATVEVSYTLGGEHASGLLSLERSEAGWRITNGAVHPQAEAFVGFPVTINGEPVTGGVPALLPGVYELGFDDEAYELPEGQQRMAIHLSDGGSSEEIDATPQLSPAGAERFATALRARLDDCLSSGTMTTDCGMDLSDADFPDGYELGGEVRRTLDPDFDTVLAEHPPQLERDATGLTGRVVLPAEFAARIDLQVRKTSDGSIRTGHMRDPEPSLRPRAYLSDGSASIEWFSPDAS